MLTAKFPPGMHPVLAAPGWLASVAMAQEFLRTIKMCLPSVTIPPKMQQLLGNLGLQTNSTLARNPEEIIKYGVAISAAMATAFENLLAKIEVKKAAQEQEEAAPAEAGASGHDDLTVEQLSEEEKDGAGSDSSSSGAE